MKRVELQTMMVERSGLIFARANPMATDHERLEALERFAVHITRLTNFDWVDGSIREALDIALKDPARGATMYQLGLMLSEGRQRIPAPVAPPSPTSVQSPVDANEILRRNGLLLDHYEREVGISKSYSTVIGGIGYAGLLAIWGGFRDHIDKVSLLVSGALIGLSLAVFVVWEMTKVNVAQVGADALQRVVAEKFWTADFETACRVARAEVIAKTGYINRFQPVVFWASTVTGFSAAVLLIFTAIRVATGLKITLG